LFKYKIQINSKKTKFSLKSTFINLLKITISLKTADVLNKVL
jgi:hypothetical protein